MLPFIIWGVIRIAEKDGLGGLFLLIWFCGMYLLIVGIRGNTEEISKEVGFTEGYDQGQIDALHGIQTHEMFLVYPTGDTIASDTLYLKINE